jgi:DNA-binding IclR family transcriptional regulator
MAHPSSALAGRPSSFDIKRAPLSIRALRARRPAPISIVDRVRAEFAEMRGFSPTLAQAARLFGLPVEECDRVLRSLVQDGSLTRGSDGRYRLAR